MWRREIHMNPLAANETHNDSGRPDEVGCSGKMDHLQAADSIAWSGAWSTVRNKNDTRPVNRKGNVSDFVKDLHAGVDLADKDGPGVIGSTFGTAKSERGGLRHKGNVQAVHFLFFDLDHQKPGADAQALAVFSGCACVAHTSFNHGVVNGSGEPDTRFRLYLPLKRSVTIEEHAALWRWGADLLSGAGVPPDESAKDAVRLFYGVRAKNPAAQFTPWFHVQVGEPLDPDQVKPVERAPATASVFVPLLASTPGDEERRKYCLSALESACRNIEESGTRGGAHETLLKEAHAVGGLLHAGAFSIEQALDALSFAGVRAGHQEGEARRVAGDGLRDGARKPREIPGGVRVPCVGGTFEPGALRRIFNPARSTEQGNAERLAALKGPDLRYTSGHGWHIWSGTHWVQDDVRIEEVYRKSVVDAIYREAAEANAAHNGKLAEDLSRWARRSENASTLRGSLLQARSFPGVYMVDSDFDCDLFAFNVLSGTIDLRTGELRPHRREDLITRISPVVYDPAAPCPLWERFLLRIMNGRQSMVDFLRRAFGYMLTGAISEQCFFFAYGTGKNGKSTLIDVVSALVGDYGHRAEIDTFMDSHQTGGNSPGVAAASKARLVFASETEEGRALSMARLKDMTSGERQTACMKYKNPFQFMPEWKIWLSGNHQPRVRDTTMGAWRRIRFIPFDVQIPAEECDPDLPRKLRAELPGILAWAVRGCLEWQRVGLQAPAEIIAATDDYRQSQDVVSCFLTERCYLAKYERVEIKALYMEYGDWCEENGDKHPMTRRRFSTCLVEKGMRRVRGHGGVWHFAGVRLRQTNDPVSGDIGDECDANFQNSLLTTSHGEFSQNNVTNVTNVTEQGAQKKPDQKEDLLPVSDSTKPEEWELI